MTKKTVAKKMMVKGRGESMGFDSKWKILQHDKKPSEKVVNMRGYDQEKRRREEKKQGESPSKVLKDSLDSDMILS